MARNSGTLLAAISCLVFCGYSHETEAATTSAAQLTANEIVHRAAVVEGIRDRGPYTDARIAHITEGGHSFTELVLVKSPNKLLIRDEYPWLHLIVYRGYDGNHAWTSSNLGGGGLADPAMERAIQSNVAWYTSSDMVPGRWPVTLVRLPDRTIDRKSYFAIEEVPAGGNPTHVFFDKATFAAVALNAVGDRYFKCVGRKNTHSICLHQELMVGGRVSGSITIKHLPMSLDDSQFQMPLMLEDRTTPWFLARYARAVGTSRSAILKLRGELFVTVGEARYVAEWALNASQPASFVNSFSNRGRDFYTLAFNGVQGTLISNDVVRKAPDVAAVYGMVYNRCELHAAACGVVVTRLANIGIEGRSFYALGVMSVREPFLWYTVLLDEETGLPFAYWMRDAVLYVRDYAPGSSGEMIPSYWRFDRTNSQVEVIHVREAAGLPR